MLPLCCVPRSKHFGIVPAKLLHAFLVLSSNRQFLRAKGPTVCMNHKRCNYMQISNTHNHLQIINVPADSVGQKSHSPWSAARAWRMAYIFGRLHFLVLQRTGDIESVDPDKPGWGRSRTICARSILAWRQQGSVQWTDRHGDYSRRWLRLPDTLQRERAARPST